MYVVLFFRFVHIPSQHICYGEKMFHTKVVNNNETHLLSVHFFHELFNIFKITTGKGHYLYIF